MAEQVGDHGRTKHGRFELVEGGREWVLEAGTERPNWGRLRILPDDDFVLHFDGWLSREALADMLGQIGAILVTGRNTWPTE